MSVIIRSSNTFISSLIPESLTTPIEDAFQQQSIEDICFEDHGKKNNGNKNIFNPIETIPNNLYAHFCNFYDS